MEKAARLFLLLIPLALLPASEARDRPRTILPFGPGDSLETIRAKIRHNGYAFTVDHNWVYDMPAEMKREFFRLRRSPFADIAAEDIGPLAKHLGETPPAQFDWRNYDGRSYIGPVRNQGYCSSCYAFGACAAAEGTYNFAAGRYGQNCIDLSEAFIAWCLGELSPYSSHFYDCVGADMSYMELQALVEQGVCEEQFFPYSDSASQSCPPEAWDAARLSFGSWHRVTCGDIDAIKTAIMTYGVVDAAVKTTSAFQAYSGGVYEDDNTVCYGVPCDQTPADHAIALVGWDDAEECWILRNSWGPEWGEGGYMRIKYNSAVVSCAVAYLADPQPYNPPTPVPQMLTVSVSPESKCLFKPLQIEVHIKPIDHPCDAWGVIYRSNGQIASFIYGNPSAISKEVKPLARGIRSLPDGCDVTLLSVRGVPLGWEGNNRVVVGLFPEGTIPAGPEDAFPGCVDEAMVSISMP